MHYQLAAAVHPKVGAHGLVPFAVGRLVILCGALVAEDPTAVGDRHIGGHGAVRAPVVAVWVIADADGGLQAAFCHFATTAPQPHFFKCKPHAGNPF